jgi:hypothetical protein
MVWIRDDLAERFATTSARIASTFPARVLAAPQLAFRLRGAGGLDRVDGIGLALAPAFLAVRAVDLENFYARSPQVAGQAGPIRAGALHPDPHRRAERAQPDQQRLVARRGGRKLLHPQQTADAIKCSGYMHIQVRVHATRDRARGIYHCHRHPYLSRLGSGWHRRLRAARWIVLFQQGDPPHSTGGTTTEVLADHALLRQADRQPTIQARPDLDRLTVTPTTSKLVDPDQPYLHSPCRIFRPGRQGGSARTQLDMESYKSLYIVESG